MEQGFDLRSRPAGAGATALTLAVRVGGTLRARLMAGGVSFVDAHGRTALRYQGLEATDAGNHPLRSWLELRSGVLLLRVADAHARYPLRVDPFVQQGTKLTPSDGTAGANFGYSTALSADGNTALVGAVGDTANAGAAWVFTRSGATWSQQGSKITPSDETGSGFFGFNVALSADGNTALIGGPLDSSGNGAAWVFTRSGATWSQQGSKIIPSDETGQGRFGSSTALSADGNTALLGGELDNGGPGAAWVFTRSGATWTQQGQKLTPSDESPGNGNFGFAGALSSDGNSALITAPSDGGGANGAAWAFTRAGSTWSQQGSKLTPSDEAGGGQFGYDAALSSDGNTALIGGAFDNSNKGAAWAFTRSGSSWSQQGLKLTPSDETGAALFGNAVALACDGNTALMGGYVDNGTKGAAWAFTRSGSTWSQQGSKLTPSDESGTGAFGFSAALSADAATALIGGSADASSAGAAWVFTGPASSATGCAPAATSPPATTPPATTPPATTSQATTPAAHHAVPPVSTPPAKASAVGCVARKLILTDVFPRAGRTQLLGVAPPGAAGKRVTIVSAWNGKPVAKPTVQPDLSFSATAPLPPPKLRFTNKARYFATLGSQRSLVLKFARRMYTTAITIAGRAITFTGTITRPLAKPFAPVAIRASASCSAIGQGVIVATVKPSASGAFTARFNRPVSQSVLYLRAETKVRNNTRSKKTFATFTLIRGLNFGG